MQSRLLIQNAKGRSRSFAMGFNIEEGTNAKYVKLISYHQEYIWQICRSGCGVELASVEATLGD